jgi:hypothetical protein
MPRMIGQPPLPESAQANAAALPEANVDSAPPSPPAVEIGGRDGPEPTRFGDWEKNGRCIDF